LGVPLKKRRSYKDLEKQASGRPAYTICPALPPEPECKKVPDKPARKKEKQPGRS